MRERDDVLWMDFGAMKRDLPGQVERVAAAMGVELSDAERAAVIERSGCAWMLDTARRFAPLLLPGPLPRPVMVRSGGSGELLNVEQPRSPPAGGGQAAALAGRVLEIGAASRPTSTRVIAAARFHTDSCT